ncbi:MdtA/MuxA family multidrug efflux RND transporter periplasmic adaptor subunit [Inquilinus sp. Marseille-Q2685]|uniref:MdtA/MuxA family multidrug efflux RND transporter periplasmic adaptor subunit n=1 Tax=Inquilinus sp. Marseille-Q2685 TaxID=2866581 RepID=UPI001CE3FD6A|nr:MdtA/MuxA family multidrug efflux RND transporter periplasmic adaptor subunit [Inquilinus sp. Marseille-Q2685]
MDARVEDRQRPGEEKRPGPARRRGRLVWGTLGLAAAALIAFATWRVVTAPGTPAPARGGRFADAAPQPVGVVTVGRGDIRITLDALGTVTPLATVTVKPQIAGQLTEVGFQEGQTVKQGDFLAQIDPRPYQVALEQDQGQLARDQAALAQAQSDLARDQQMLKQNAVSRQQVDDQAFLVQQDQGTIQSDQAQIDAQKLNLAYARIVSPVDGRVGLRQVDPGNYVQVGDALVIVTQLHPISVVFSLPEDALPQIQARLRAGASLPVIAFDRSGTTQIAAGTLSTLDNQIDTTTGTVKLRAGFDNADETLFPNQFVNARLLVDTRQDVVTVPVAAVQHGAPGAFVYLVGAGDTVAVRPIKTGPSDGGMVAVEDGLQPGDRVVVDGTDRLRDGAHVTVAGGDGAGQGAAPAAPADGQAGQQRHRQGPGEGGGQHRRRNNQGQQPPANP